MRERFPNPSRIVIAGSSAGGYGTFAAYAVTRVAYPTSPIIVFNDSGPGVQNFDASDDVQSRVANWDFAGRVPESCTECDTSTPTSSTGRSSATRRPASPSILTSRTASSASSSTCRDRPISSSSSR